MKRIDEINLSVVPGTAPFDGREKLEAYFKTLFDKRAEYLNAIQERRRRAESSPFRKKYPLFQENY